MIYLQNYQELKKEANNMEEEKILDLENLTEEMKEELSDNKGEE